MSFFNKMSEPVFLKEESTAKQRLEALQKIKDNLNAEGQTIIDKDIRLLRYGIAGEQNIAFELKNSHMPMYILHDIFFEHNGLTAQIDYIIITRKIVFLIECKNLYGNIEIDNNGNFIRTMYYGNKPVKEGIYSPITQNNRHMELLKAKKTECKNKLMALAIKHRFYDNYKSVVVLANPRSVLNCRYAKKEIKEQVIRADRLIEYIKDECKKSKNPESSDKEMYDIAMNLLKWHREQERDYTKKYNDFIEVIPVSGKTENRSRLYDMLKEFRLRKSLEENLKPYYIYNNKQLEELVEKQPMSKEELIHISGFGEIKTEKYGMDIIRIIAHCVREN